MSGKACRAGRGPVKGFDAAGRRSDDGTGNDPRWSKSTLAKTPPPAAAKLMRPDPKHAGVSTPYCPPRMSPLNMFYEDEHLLVTDKPSGLLSVPGRGPEKADCLVSRVQVSHPGALIVHRLDMETSGLMVLALNPDVHRALSGQFENRLVAKRYVARVSGVPEQSQGRIDLPLLKDWPNRPLQKVDHEAGKPSVTEWCLLEKEQDAARLELTPLTGRSHQLRVHLNAIGYPILGDLLYGNAKSRTGALRLQLHASSLSFAHPVSGEKMRFCAQSPF